MNSIEFARNLFSLRMERKLSVEDLATRLGVTPEQVCEWECARTSPTVEQMLRLSRVYGVGLEEIVRPAQIRDPEEPPKEPEPEIPAAPAPQPADPIPAPPAPEEPAPAPQKKRVRWWEILIALLLVLTIAGTVTFLCVPDLFQSIGEWFVSMGNSLGLGN